ncbi:hypothetical protein AOC36_09175 [Erysipelothrix larvae]|uniref:Uncharacterized protein n=1 Tax=Erysipelothrix larvae TaxID=1514105 RepID=A0A109UHF7_9FIRM|nr:hypothetical protein [Erysipelothrix larvae]AMC94153.1 hypothetical protein AOC36_09175 [Erysipelothrix larvae]
MFWNRKKKASREQTQRQPIHMEPRVEPLDFTVKATQEEVELVSVITSSILTQDKTDTTFKVRSVRRVDEDKVAVAAIVASVLAQDKPESSVRLVSLHEVNKEEA